MTIARNAAVQGDWMLLGEPLDKPPLTYYANALSLVFFAIEADSDGVLFLDNYKGEFAGRLFALYSSVIIVAVTMAWAKSLFPKDTYLRAIWGVLMALSPLRIAFAATAFTDVPMLLFALIAFWMSARKRWSWAGFWFGVSFIAKPQSIFILPLLGSLILWDTRLKRKDSIHTIAAFAIPCFLLILALWGWDLARMQHGADSFWALGQAHYSPLRIAHPAEYPERWLSLWATLQFLFGHAFVTMPILLLIGFDVVRRRRVLEIIFSIWVLLFVLAHIMLTFNLFDRNLLILLPIIGLLAARVLSAHTDRRWLILGVVIGMVGMAPASVSGKIPIGGDRGQHESIDHLAAYLNDLPVASVIYDRWLDWELDYYLGAWTNKRRVYYPTPQHLAKGTLSLHEKQDRYFVIPRHESSHKWLQALSDVGFDSALAYETEKFLVYIISPP